MKTLSLIVALILSLAVQAKAQFCPTFCIGGSEPQQKFFEQEPLFGTPRLVMPNHVGPLESMLTGVTEHPLLGLALNPSLLPKSNHYIYADFSTPPTQSSVSPYPCPNCLATDDLSIYIPNDERWKRSQPQASLAYLGRPFGDRNIFVGAAYQGLFFSSDYYNLPRFSYRTTAETGSQDFSSTNGILPTSNSDHMMRTGHFVTLWAGYQLDKTSVGLRVNRSVFDKTGREQFGDTFNFPDDPFLPSPANNYFATESRKQGYGHWDVNLGLSSNITRDFQAGISIGYLIGSGQQGLTNNSSSFLLDGGTSEQSYNILSSYDLESDRGWDVDGQTWYANLHGRYARGENSHLFFSYQGAILDNSLLLQTEYQQQGYSESQFTYQDTTRFTASNYSSRSFSLGSGTHSDSRHQLSGINYVKYSNGAELAFGLQIVLLTRSFDTSEEFISNQYNYYASRSEPPPGPAAADTSETRIRTHKMLHWDYTSTYTGIGFPLYINAPLNEWLEINAGIKPRISHEQYRDRVTDRILTRTVEVDGSTERERGIIYRDDLRENETFFEVPTLVGVAFKPATSVVVRLSTSPTLFRKQYAFTNRSNWQGFLSLSIWP